MFMRTLVLFLTLASAVVCAEEEPASKWSGDAELGYMKTTGNTDTKSLHAKGKLINERTKWRHTVTGEVVNKSDSGDKTAERYLATGKTDYKINDRSYVFVMLSYEDDKFSGYEYQSSEVLGYGYSVIKEENLKLDLEAGAGARQSKPESDSRINEGVVKGAANLEWKISDTTTFTQLLSVEAGEDITVGRSASGLVVRIIGNLAAKFSFNVKHTSDVEPGFDKTDTESVVTLVYSF